MAVRIRGLLIFLALSFVASAQETPPKEKEVVITATRVEREREGVPGSVTVISGGDLEKVNLQDVGDALEDVQGLQVFRYGALGSEATVHLRGLYGVHTLVLVDGRPVNAPSLSVADLSWLSPGNIERIEVVRGAGSALYGADAVGGVVQILTAPPPEKPTAKFGGSAGTWHTLTSRFSHGATLGKKGEDDVVLGYVVGGETRSTAGFRDNDDYKAEGLDLKLCADILQKAQVTVTSGYGRTELELPGPRPPADPALWTASQMALGNDEVSALYDGSETARRHVAAEARAGNLVARGWRNDWEEDLHQEYIHWSGDRIGDDFDHDTAMDGGEAQYTWDVHENDSITVGAAFRRDAFKSRTYELDYVTGAATESQWEAKRRTRSLFVQNELRLGPARFCAGGRWDDPSDFDGQVTGRAGVVYELPTRTTLRLTGGQAYRAPSLNDLYWPSDSWAQGNVELETEKGVTFEFGAEQKVGEALTVGATVFRQKMRRMIAWVPTGPPGAFGPKWQPDNLNRAEIDGVEGEAVFRPCRVFTASLRYTWLDAVQEGMELTDSVTNAMAEERRRLAYAPRHKLDAGAGVDVEGFRADVSWQVRSAVFQYYPRYAPFPDTWIAMDKKSLPASSVVNAKVSRKFERLEIFLAGDNLFNQEYAMQFGSTVDDRDYPMPGRSFTAGAGVEF